VLVTVGAERLFCASRAGVLLSERGVSAGTGVCRDGCVPVVAGRAGTGSVAVGCVAVGGELHKFHFRSTKFISGQ